MGKEIRVTNNPKYPTITETHQVFSNNILNIFCDASIIDEVSDPEPTRYYKKKIGCAMAAGFIGIGQLANNSPILEYHHILRWTTNNESEIYALYLAVQMAKDAIETLGVTTVNIFADSNFALLGVKEWIYGWTKKSTPGGPLINSSNNEVANQRYFLYIIDTIMKYQLNISLVHVDGHINTNSMNDVIIACNKFQKANSINIFPDPMRSICLGNDYVDTMSRSILFTNKFDIVPRHSYVIQPVYEPFNEKNYKKLTGGIVNYEC